MDARQKDKKSRWFSLAQGAPLTALAIMYNQVLSFVVGILVARVIGASDYGVTNISLDDSRNSCDHQSART
jgi:hypothetical protein